MVRLEERAAQWRRAPQDRFLPNAFECVSIGLGVPRSKRTADQRKMMRTATRFHGLRAGLMFVVLLLIGGAAGWLWNDTQEKRTELLVKAVLIAPPDIPL
jgi:hypothetical protein